MDIPHIFTNRAVQLVLQFVQILNLIFINISSVIKLKPDLIRCNCSHYWFIYLPSYILQAFW